VQINKLLIIRKDLPLVCNNCRQKWQQSSYPSK